MNILQATKYYYPKTGGIEWVAQTLAEEFMQRKNSVKVVATSNNTLGERQMYNNVSTVKSTNFGELLSVPLAPTFAFHLRAAEKWSDITHFHLSDPLAVSSHVALGTDNVVTVATFHNNIARQQRMLKLYRPLLNQFLKSLDKVFVTSERLKEKSDLLDPVREKCEVIPLGIDLDEWGDYTGKRYELPGDASRPTLLFVGRIVYYKGISYLVKSMEGVDADLIVVGKGELSTGMENLTRDLGISDKVHMVGHISHERLKYYYSVADVLVLPSIATSEGFGLVQLEAMSYGTPVINTNIDTGVPYVSKHGETGLTVPPRDPTELANAIRELTMDKEKMREYGTAARRRVKQKFAVDKMIDEYQQQYADLLRR